MDKRSLRDPRECELPFQKVEFFLRDPHQVNSGMDVREDVLHVVSLDE